MVKKRRVVFEPLVVHCEYIKGTQTSPLMLVNCHAVALRRDGGKKCVKVKKLPKRTTKQVQK